MPATMAEDKLNNYSTTIFPDTFYGVDTYYRLPVPYDYLSYTGNRFELVSSLYGPGTIICWYLTILACLASWTIHVKKSRNDSIDTDLITMVALPCLASGHLIYQASFFSEKVAEAQVQGTSLYFRNYSRAVEAALNVTDTSFMLICICILVTAFKRSMYRTILLSTVVVLCLLAENILVARLQQAGLTPSYHFYRRPLAEFTPFLWATNVTIGTLVVLSIGLSVSFLIDYCTLKRASNDGERLERRIRNFRTSHHVSKITMLLFVFLPISFVMTFIPLLEFPTAYGRIDHLTASDYCRRLISALFPRSGMSISDLDQAAALMAGVAALSLSLYSAAKSRYQDRVRQTQPVDDL